MLHPILTRIMIQTLSLSGSLRAAGAPPASSSSAAAPGTFGELQPADIEPLVPDYYNMASAGSLYSAVSQQPGAGSNVAFGTAGTLGGAEGLSTAQFLNPQGGGGGGPQEYNVGTAGTLGGANAGSRAAGNGVPVGSLPALYEQSWAEAQMSNDPSRSRLQQQGNQASAASLFNSSAAHTSAATLPGAGVQTVVPSPVLAGSSSSSTAKARSASPAQPRGDAQGAAAPATQPNLRRPAQGTQVMTRSERDLRSPKGGASARKGNRSRAGNSIVYVDPTSDEARRIKDAHRASALARSGRSRSGGLGSPKSGGSRSPSRNNTLESDVTVRPRGGSEVGVVNDTLEEDKLLFAQVQRLKDTRDQEHHELFGIRVHSITGKKETPRGGFMSSLMGGEADPAYRVMFAGSKRDADGFVPLGRNSGLDADRSVSKTDPTASRGSKRDELAASQNKETPRTFLGAAAEFVKQSDSAEGKAKASVNPSDVFVDLNGELLTVKDVPVNREDSGQLEYDTFELIVETEGMMYNSQIGKIEVGHYVFDPSVGSSSHRGGVEQILTKEILDIKTGKPLNLQLTFEILHNPSDDAPHLLKNPNEQDVLDDNFVDANGVLHGSAVNADIFDVTGRDVEIVPAEKHQYIAFLQFERLSNLPEPGGYHGRKMLNSEIEIKILEHSGRRVLDKIGPIPVTHEKIGNDEFLYCAEVGARKGLKTDLCIEDGTEPFMLFTLEVSYTSRLGGNERIGPDPQEVGVDVAQNHAIELGVYLANDEVTVQLADGSTNSTHLIGEGMMTVACNLMREEEWDAMRYAVETGGLVADPRDANKLADSSAMRVAAQASQRAVAALKGGDTFGLKPSDLTLSPKNKAGRATQAIPGFAVLDHIIPGTEGDADNTIMARPYNDEEKEALKGLKQRSLIDRLFGTKTEKNGSREGGALSPRGGANGIVTAQDDPMRTRMAEDAGNGGNLSRSLPMTGKAPPVGGSRGAKSRGAADEKINLDHIDSVDKHLLVAMRGQQKALEKKLEAQGVMNPPGGSYLEKGSEGFRTWNTLDDMFSSMGTHPVTKSRIYEKTKVIRAVEPVARVDRLDIAYCVNGMEVRRGVDWCWGNEDLPAEHVGSRSANAGAAAAALKVLGDKKKSFSDVLDATGADGRTGRDKTLSSEEEKLVKAGMQTEGAGVGQIVGINHHDKTVTVLWMGAKETYDHYRVGKGGKYDLAAVKGEQKTPLPIVCEDVHWIKTATLNTGNMSPRARAMASQGHKTVLKTKYVAEVSTKETHKSAYETLRYASYNPQQDAKVPYKDIHPAYRIDEDVWGKGEDAGNSDLEWMKRLFVPTCVRNEFWLA